MRYAGPHQHASIKSERRDSVTDLGPGRKKRPEPVEYQRFDIARRDAHPLRWRSGLMASVLMGTLLSEVDDTSILRKRPTGQHHCSLKCSLRSQKSRPPQRAIAAAI
jgi:hypothetical protein